MVREAQALAAAPYVPPHRVPAFLRHLTYNAYQSIRFRPDRSLWRKRHHSRFEVQLIAPGLYYTTPVRLLVVSGCRVRPLPFRPSDFTYPSPALEKQIPKTLGYAGFKLTYPLVGRDCCNQFLVFAGASYFRAVGRPNNFGLSARGIAINTAFPPHEEFPVFQKFWLMRPRQNAHHMVIDALLNGPSVAGAYRFTIRPGQATQIKMRVRLFFRHAPRVLGIAPLTSMFFYGAGTPRPVGEWRPAVHDSDGLELANGNGEWIWRPLINPPRFQVTSFQLDNPRGFGLMQRDQRFSGYEDLGARYDTRPSAWVVPEGRWGRGRVELVEIPTASETVDNIVAYWVPHQPVTPGREYRYDYRVLFGRASIARQPAGYVIHTFVGAGRNPGMPCTTGRHTLRLIVDFAVPRASLSTPAQGVVSAIAPARIRGVTVMTARGVVYCTHPLTAFHSGSPFPKGIPSSFGHSCAVGPTP
ncbi:periplasmic glucan biosynthesis protein MdoG [mine drainage metagenome]|uniref:Periplasmic glucan biosynthesis protein MdoG n=2 Tax=mine drainage metagenome TaxID=410659 RepID=T1AIZ6_9ZZZZ